MSRAHTLRGAVLGLLLAVVIWTPALAADRVPQKRAQPACDQGALVSYNAYFEARRAVDVAFRDAMTAANEAFRTTMLTGKKSERKNAPQQRQHARNDARANFTRAVAALGPPPTKPPGCHSTKP
jgi:hypothetical protein